MNPTDQELVESARALVTHMDLGPDRSAATVGCALRSASGTVFTGICIDLTSGIGFCAEHSAVAEMLKNNETLIETIVAVSDSGIYPPCGRCRELLAQINARNSQTRVILGDDEILTLKELLPHHSLF